MYVTQVSCFIIDVVFNLLERVSNGLMGTAGSSSGDSSHTTTAAATSTSENNPATSPAGDGTASHRLGVGN